MLYQDQINHKPTNKPSLLIGSNNKAKIERRKRSLDEYFTVVSPQEIGISVHIDEGMDSLIENSQKKALTRANASGLLSLGDDTGFCLNALGGAPGVAVRRRGGELADDVSDEEFLDFFQKKIEPLDDTSSYREFALSLATPEGKVDTYTHQAHGYINKDKLRHIPEAQAGYPLGSCRERENNKAWHEMTDAEKKEVDGETVRELVRVAKKMGVL